VVLVTDEQAFEGEQPADAASTSKRLRLRRRERPSWSGGRLRPVRCGGNRGTDCDVQGPWTLRITLVPSRLQDPPAGVTDQEAALRRARGWAASQASGNSSSSRSTDATLGEEILNRPLSFRCLRFLGRRRTSELTLRNDRLFFCVCLHDD